MGHLFNGSLQVCLDVWNEMWFLLTLVNASMHQRIRGISFTIRKQEEGERPEQFKRNNLVIFFLGISSPFKLHSRSIHLGTPLIVSTKFNRETNAPNFLLPAGSVNETDHGRQGFPARLFSLDWLTLINSRRWFQMITVKLDLTICCLLFHTAQGLSLWHLPP